MDSITWSPNVPIELGEMPIRITIGRQSIHMATRAVLNLLPLPSLELSSIAPFPKWLPFSDIESVTLVPTNRTIKASVTISCTEQDSLATIVPLQQPLTVSPPPRRQIHALQFAILNFPSFFGRQDRTVQVGESAWLRQGAAVLVADIWRIDIAAIHDIREVEKLLKRQGGYAATHFGVAERLDGKTFSPNEAEQLLNSLRLYLSFARGGFCAPILPKGLDRFGELVWEQWGAGPVQPWGFTPSWFDTANGQLLSEVFPGFYARINDRKWADTLRTVFYWYLRSNAHGRGAGVDGGLILAQAALERLAFTDFGNTKAVTGIRKALESRRISTEIPNACKALRSLARRYNWTDGPHALTVVRNHLVHPDPRGRSVTGSYYEAWNLAQAYVELVLLALFDHHGLYGDRLTQEWQGQVIKVPWA